ncbi:hypothetical protein [Actinoplanes ianthinogenes]|uniref:hypothetical protein n=1 Tax=Actinoplanes ianthinogenes TaxID=122358 RepID=UPI00166FC34C|nr:hypothetical protein [Actinoplanes ianthinogenes]
MHDQLRRFTAGTVLLAGVLTLAGCTSDAATPGGTGQPAPMASSALPADPAAALAQAASRLGTESARFTVIFGKGERSEEKASGTVDPATGDWELIGDAYVVRRIGNDLYVKLTAEPRFSVYAGQYADDLGKWVHQVAPEPSGTVLAFGTDFPWTPARAASGMSGPARTADRMFQGTVKAGARAATDPVCTAELDVAGRFSRISTDADAVEPATVLTYSDYGLPVTITAPPAEQTIEDHLFTFAQLGTIFA